MFRREMGSKRGSLPPKEGDLTCMQKEMSHEFQRPSTTGTFFVVT